MMPSGPGNMGMNSPGGPMRSGMRMNGPNHMYPSQPSMGRGPSQMTNGPMMMQNGPMTGPNSNPMMQGGMSPHGPGMNIGPGGPGMGPGMGPNTSTMGHSGPGMVS